MSWWKIVQVILGALEFVLQQVEPSGQAADHLAKIADAKSAAEEKAPPVENP